MQAGNHLLETDKSESLNARSETMLKVPLQKRTVSGLIQNREKDRSMVTFIALF